MKELTKLHEETFYDSASSLLKKFNGKSLNGEITMIIGVPKYENIVMSKLDDKWKPIYNNDGKVMKGPNYFKPNLSKFLK